MSHAQLQQATYELLQQVAIEPIAASDIDLWNDCTTGVFTLEVHRLQMSIMWIWRCVGSAIDYHRSAYECLNAGGPEFALFFVDRLLFEVRTIYDIAVVVERLLLSVFPVDALLHSIRLHKEWACSRLEYGLQCVSSLCASYDLPLPVFALSMQKEVG